MNDERMALEDRLAALEVRASRIESEHVSLLNSYSALAAGREKLRRDLETDYELLGKAFDQRIIELAARRGDGSGISSELLVEIFREFARGGAEFVVDYVRRVSREQGDSVTRLFENQARLNAAFAARLDCLQDAIGTIIGAAPK